MVEETSGVALKAQRLRELHRPGRPLVLVNAWDAVSAKMLERMGFPAIATSSGAMAWTRGFADGERISRDEMIDGVRRVVEAVSVPVTADLERAYGPTVEDAAATARAAIEAGACGLNFEDWNGLALVDIAAQTDRIEAMMDTARSMGVPLAINARTDVYLEGVGSDDAWRFNEAVRRANAYLSAGAACAFIPGVTDEATIEALVKAVEGPISLLAGATSPPVSRMAELGIARVSVGTAGASYALAAFRDFAQHVAREGDFSLIAKRITHGETNSLFGA